MKNLVTALIKAQKQITGATKDSSNPYFKSTYADFASVWQAVKDALLDNDLAVIQKVDGANLVTILAHTSGETVESFFPITCAKPNDPQAFGSAVTYARRYALQAMLCVPSLDDDAESNYSRSQPPKQQQRYQPPAQPAKTQQQPQKREIDLATFKLDSGVLNLKNESHKVVLAALAERYPQFDAEKKKKFAEQFDGKLEASVKRFETAIQSVLGLNS
ncbi:erf superfamily [Caudoviricetes sp.]|nr:erf superfamily [Caudoviricetes sp.]